MKSIKENSDKTKNRVKKMVGSNSIKINFKSFQSIFSE